MAILSSGFQPLVTFPATFGKCRSDGVEEFAVLGSVVIHYSAYTFASVGGVECLVLLLTSLRGRYSVLCHVCHSWWSVVTSTGAVEVGLNLCSLSLCYHLDVIADDFGDAVLILADLVGECPALDD